MKKFSFFVEVRGDSDGRKLKKFLEKTPEFDVNREMGNLSRATGLHFAGMRANYAIISVLLAHPAIKVNKRDSEGRTVFFWCCWDKDLKIVELLLKDSRVDINLEDNLGRTPLWCVSYWGDVDVIKLMVASGRELNLDAKATFADNVYTAIEIAREKNKTEVVSLLERFISDQEKTRREIRLELGVVDKDAAELFAMTVFLCDDILRLRTFPLHNLNPPAVRFFGMISRLPMELQMIVCRRAFGSSKDRVRMADSELAFRNIAKSFSA